MREREWGQGAVGVLWSCAYDGVLRLATGEPVEIRVVRNVHEELRAARVGLARVGHAQGPFGVGRLVDVLVLDVAAVGSGLGAARREVFEGSVGRPAGAGRTRPWVLGVRAAKLCEHRRQNEGVSTETQGLAKRDFESAHGS